MSGWGAQAAIPVRRGDEPQEPAVGRRDASPDRPAGRARASPAVLGPRAVVAGRGAGRPEREASASRPPGRERHAAASPPLSSSTTSRILSGLIRSRRSRALRQRRAAGAAAPAQRRGRSAAAAPALQVQREGEREGGELERPVRQHRRAIRGPVGAELAATISTLAASCPRAAPRRRRAARAAPVQAGGSRSATWAISSNPKTPDSARPLWASDHGRLADAGGHAGERGRTTGAGAASSRSVAPAATTAMIAALMRGEPAVSGGRAGLHAGVARRPTRASRQHGRASAVAACAGRSSLEHAVDRLQRHLGGVERGVSLAAVQAGQVGEQDQRGVPLGGARRLRSRSAALGSRASRRATRARGRGGWGATRPVRARARRTPPRVAGSTQATCEARQRDPVGLAGSVPQSTTSARAPRAHARARAPTPSRTPTRRQARAGRQDPAAVRRPRTRSRAAAGGQLLGHLEQRLRCHSPRGRRARRRSPCRTRARARARARRSAPSGRLVLAPAPPHRPHTASSGPRACGCALRPRAAPRADPRAPAGPAIRSPGRAAAAVDRGRRLSSRRLARRCARVPSRASAAIAAHASPSCRAIVGLADRDLGALVGREGPVLGRPDRSATRPRPRVPLIHSSWAWLPLTVFSRPSSRGLARRARARRG